MEWAILAYSPKYQVVTIGMSTETRSNRGCLSSVQSRETAAQRERHAGV